MRMLNCKVFSAEKKRFIGELLMDKHIENKMTILLCTCDSYEDLWQPFFTLFDKFGGELKKHPIIINTESKQYKYPNLNIKCINQKEPFNGMTWGKRLRNVLSSISSEYVLFLLDDFFLTRKVNDSDYKKILWCIDTMEQNQDIGGMNLIPLCGADSTKEMDGFYLINPGTPYRINAQACIWRRKVLFDSILDIESPWEWEVYGNIRNDHLIKAKIYSLKDGEREPFCYGFYEYDKKNEDGSYVAKSGVMRGKWCLSSVKKLFMDNGIKVDYSIRGIYKESLRRKMHQNKFFLSTIIKPYRKLKSLLGINNGKIVEINNMENEKNMNKFVYPYIKEEHE